MLKIVPMSYMYYHLSSQPRSQALSPFPPLYDKGGKGERAWERGCSLVSCSKTISKVKNIQRNKTTYR